MSASRSVNAWAHLGGDRRVYADDIRLPRMLHGRLLRSTQPHARIKRIDVSARAGAPRRASRSSPARDMPEKMGIMPSTQDETALAVDKVRYIGEPVAAVAALDEDTADRGAFAHRRRVRAAAADLHHRGGARAGRRQDPRGVASAANVFKQVHLAFGDLEAGFAAADLVRDDWYFFEGNTHAPIETHCVRRVVRRRRQADALVGDAGPPLRPPRAREGARAASLAHPRDRDAERRRVRRQERPVRPRVLRRALLSMRTSGR